jgi:Xaa-Pro aminopeptidase
LIPRALVVAGEQLDEVARRVLEQHLANSDTRDDVGPEVGSVLAERVDDAIKVLSTYCVAT